jgi:hypothetical protein
MKVGGSDFKIEFLTTPQSVTARGKEGRCSKLSLLKKRDVGSQRTYFLKAKR